LNVNGIKSSLVHVLILLLDCYYWQLKSLHAMTSTLSRVCQLWLFKCWKIW